MLKKIRMRIIAILALFLSINQTFTRAALPLEKIIQVKFSKNIGSANFFSNDAAFNDVFINLINSEHQDTVITKKVSLNEGQILRYAVVHKKDERQYLITKSFIVPSTSDTIKLEVLNDYDLRRNDRGYFIEEILSLVKNDPLPATQNDDNYLTNEVEFQKIKEIFKINKDSLESRYAQGILEKNDYKILSMIAKNDYYIRLLNWAHRNKKYGEIKDDMTQLGNEKELIQSVFGSQVGFLFNKYINYIIFRDQLDAKNNVTMVNAIIGLGWHKGITFEMIARGLENRNKDNATSLKSYHALKTYLNGEYENKLAKLAKIILPKLTHTEKAILTTLTGKQQSFKQLLANHPGKLFIIDFWASWCKPCRLEAPFFEAEKAKLSGNKIIFLSISIDEDDKTSDWKKALKDDGFLNATNHYKLLKPKNNPLFEAFGMPSIPRYVLINDKGEFINPDFPFPSDPEFSKKLLSFNNVN